VMIGQPPDCHPFREMFDWPDAVVNVKPDGSDVMEVLSDLARQPDRIREIGRRNALGGLQRHDWAYRWRRILEIGGLRPAAGMEDRENALRKLAEQAKVS
jgi:hypothetical protein